MQRVWWPEEACARDRNAVGAEVAPLCIDEAVVVGALRRLEYVGRPLGRVAVAGLPEREVGVALGWGSLEDLASYNALYTVVRRPE